MIAADEARVALVIKGAGLGVPIGWQNRVFRPPERTANPSNPAAFVTVELDYADDTLTDFDGGRMRNGSAVVGVWVETGMGAARSRELVDEILAAFQAADVPGAMTYLEAQTDRVGSYQDPNLGDWYLWIVRQRFIAQGGDVVAPSQSVIESTAEFDSAHGLSVGDPVYRTNSSGAPFALASSSADTTLSIGVVSKVLGPTRVRVATHGVVGWTGHGLGSPGARLFLTAAGGLTTSEPDSGISQEVAIVWSSGSILVGPQAGVIQ